MRLLFVCNAFYNMGNIQIASWIEGIVNTIPCEDQVIILAPNNQKRVNRLSGYNTHFLDRNVKYYSSDGYNVEENARIILKEENPDVIIIFGTEFRFSYDALLAAEKEKVLDKAVIFAQGFSSVCGRHYAEGLPNGLLKRKSFRDFLRGDSIALQIKKFNECAETENKILKLTHNMIGRTTMDYSLLHQCNDSAKYFKCNDILRDCFYAGEWSYEHCHKHSILVSQYYYPLKGFHYLLEAVSIVKEKYPDVSVVAAGYNPIGSDIKKRSIKDSSYIIYLRKLAKKYDVEENLSFVGILNAQEMKEEYLKSNVFVLPSTIENSPNSLAEAMYLGVPSIAADVGGVSDFAEHKKEAFLYPSSASYLLAYYIMDIFEHAEKAIKMGIAGRERAKKEYNKEKNGKRFLEIIECIANIGEV